MITDKELKKLYILLDQASQLLLEFSGGTSNNFSSVEEFHSALSVSITRLKSGIIGEIDNQYFWFAPTSDWDDLVGRNGETLANQIFEVLTDLRKQISHTSNKPNPVTAIPFVNFCICL